MNVDLTHSLRCFRPGQRGGLGERRSADDRRTLGMAAQAHSCAHPLLCLWSGKSTFVALSYFPFMYMERNFLEENVVIKAAI